MKEKKLAEIKDALKVQFQIPELDIIRNEIGKCYEVSAFHGCITLTNLLLERYCKLILIYKATGFKTIQNLKDIEGEFKIANKKYASMTLGETLKQCKEQNIITEDAYNVFVIYKSRFRDGLATPMHLKF
jgi:hypothetical protein